tara:strand:- start:1208 stop:1870 length:663 start_codon:yes stop_codon:yes gene_type:complete
MIIGKGDLRQFLNDYPFMALKPTKDDSIILKGDFQFIAKSENGPEVRDNFDLMIKIPFGFPKKIPKVWETNNKIPRTKEGEFHVNPDDSLCLGSPLRILDKIDRTKTLVGFTKSCLVPFLYAVSIKIQKGGDFYMGELAHGLPGILDDYKDLFGIDNDSMIIETLKLIGSKKRIANKKPCTCSCGKRLGKCNLRFTVNRLRTTASRSWFKKHAKSPATLS